MNIDAYRKGEAGAVVHCPARPYCALGSLCGVTAEEHGGAQLFPTILDVRSGELVWSDLRYEQRVFVIQSGIFECTSNLNGAQETTFALYGSGYVIGIGELYLPRHIASSYYLRSLTNGRVCSFAAKTLRRWLENASSPQSHYVLCSSLTNIASAAYTYQRMVSRTPLSDRVSLLLLILRELCAREGRLLDVVELTHEEISRLCRADRVAVTRALHKLESDGFVALGYRSIRLADRLMTRSDLLGEASPVFHTPK